MARLAPADGGASRAQATTCRRTRPAPSGRWAACTRGTSCASHESGRSTTRGTSRRDATPWLTCHAKPPTEGQANSSFARFGPTPRGRFQTALTGTGARLPPRSVPNARSGSRLPRPGAPRAGLSDSRIRPEAPSRRRQDVRHGQRRGRHRHRAGRRSVPRGLRRSPPGTTRWRWSAASGEADGLGPRGWRTRGADGTRTNERSKRRKAARRPTGPGAFFVSFVTSLLARPAAGPAPRPRRSAGGACDTAGPLGSGRTPGGSAAGGGGPGRRAEPSHPKPRPSPRRNCPRAMKPKRATLLEQGVYQRPKCVPPSTYKM
jgi:hypothetical protein